MAAPGFSLRPAVGQIRLVHEDSPVGDVAQFPQAGRVEQDHFGVTPEILDQLQGVAEIRIPAYQNRHFVMPPDSVRNHIGSQLDVYPFLLGRTAGVAVDQPAKSHFQVVNPPQMLEKRFCCGC